MNDFKEIINFARSTLSFKITTFNGVIPNEYVEVPIESYQKKEKISIRESEWNVEWNIIPVTGQAGTYEGMARFSIISGELNNANVAVKVSMSDWSADHYVMMPAAVYNGNRYRTVKKKYPPMLNEEDGIGVNMPITITDVPHLNRGGEEESRIHLLSGDMATPCVGIHSPKDGKGFMLLAEHNTPIGYTGLLLDESLENETAYLQLEAPAIRHNMYQMMRSDVPSDDCGYNFQTGDSVTLRFRLYEFDCPKIPSLFKKYCDIRDDLSGEPSFVHTLPLSKAFRIIEDKYIKTQWNEKQQYLKVGTKDGKFEDWQAGWVGGGMNSLAFLMDGRDISKERASITMDTMLKKLQAPTGYIYPNMYNGKLFGDDFHHSHKINFLLIRKNADVLLFAARHIILLQKRNEEVPIHWIEGLKKLADAFVRLWEKYGQFGQFIDIAKEEIIVGGTASGSTAPGGLALAWVITENKKYLDTAITSGKYYYENYVSKGIMNGGPGEILQGADSEAAFGLLESYVTLYEVTGDSHWLPIAEECAWQCASWCVSYDFDFPKDSVFGQLGMKTTGSVYANIQNKHSAPGICTLSGVSLVKLYRATGNTFYLKLCREIAHNITQYISREDRPILSWDGIYLPSGWMCERVNMSDWESKKNVGGVFYGSCWCEISCMLTYNEIPGVWMLADTGEAIFFDHVDVDVVDEGQKWVVTLNNLTEYEAEVKVLTETRANFNNIWGQCTLEECSVVNVPAGERTTFDVIKV